MTHRISRLRITIEPFDTTIPNNYHHLQIRFETTMNPDATYEVTRVIPEDDLFSFFDQLFQYAHDILLSELKRHV